MMVHLLQEFDPGDLVELKSGSPVMTVSRKEYTQAGYRYVCHWFVNQEVRHGEFYGAELKPFVGDWVKPNER